MTPDEDSDRPVALVTGTTRGLGEALADALVARGWHVVGGGRDPERLRLTGARWGSAATLVAGDVADPACRARLSAAAAERGGARLLVHNAGELGPSPLPRLAALAPADLRRVLEVGVVAPLALTQLLLPQLRAHGGTVVAITSDTAVEAYEGWGGYGAAKAALDQLVAVLAVEEPALRVLALDPGDMATAMHQAAFPGEDISDRPDPASVVPALLAALDGDAAGRLRAADLAGVTA